MPWKMADATAKTSKADTPAAQEQWATVANKVLVDTGDDGRAIRSANAAVAARKKIDRKRSRAKSRP